ncbi:MAG: 23S rRNA (uracil(747)-C(5))-methyltransferase RlmC [Rothia sp. (in: high G+C Gram-positive bacteria)]|nr:23S rRNA (uracil(747)-C(5))-methyltransferase RlmC [Rothia sp. (in: high G+C Gram-positive bacteria)]
MQCHYFDAGSCRSCSLLPLAYPQQLANQQDQARSLLAPWPSMTWLDPLPSPSQAFRNKAKLVIAGSSQEPTLGILDSQGRGQDLQDCPLYLPALSQAFPVLEEVIRRADLTPYSVSQRRGELKHILITASDSGQLMIRFVLRSKKLLVPIRRQLPWLQQQLPNLTVLSINLLREHQALLEGPEEIILTEASTLPMQVNGFSLELRPQSFFQTNTFIAAALYRQAQAWIAAASPSSVWDLYSGVGGFALHAAAALPPSSRVTGIEISPEAVASAQATAAQYGLRGLNFIAQDAPAYALSSGQVPDVLIVNPPRRGLGADLSGWIEGSGIQQVIYSSCNLSTLVRDLKDMPSYQPLEGQVLDMFPHTGHYETLILLDRQA